MATIKISDKNNKQKEKSLSHSFNLWLERNQNKRWILLNDPLWLRWWCIISHNECVKKPSLMWPKISMEERLLNQPASGKRIQITWNKLLFDLLTNNMVWWGQRATTNKNHNNNNNHIKPTSVLLGPNEPQQISITMPQHGQQDRPTYHVYWLGWWWGGWDIRVGRRTKWVGLFTLVCMSSRNTNEW